MKKMVRKMMLKLRSNKRGQGMTEYIIIVALIAIAAIGVIGLFGENVRAMFATAGNALTGEGTRVDGTAMDADEGRNMGNFNESAEQIE